MDTRIKAAYIVGACTLFAAVIMGGPSFIERFNVTKDDTPYEIIQREERIEQADMPTETPTIKQPQTDNQGTIIFDPDVTFVEDPASITQLKTMNVQKVTGGVVVRYRWTTAPEGQYTLTGETWDHSVPGHETLTFSKESEDTGEIYIPVSDWSTVTHARVVATGPAQSWQSCGGFLIVP